MTGLRLRQTAKTFLLLFSPYKDGRPWPLLSGGTGARRLFLHYFSIFTQHFFAASRTGCSTYFRAEPFLFYKTATVSSQFFRILGFIALLLFLGNYAIIQLASRPPLRGFYERKEFSTMEFTYQSTMQLPASYAVLSEDEMVYTVGGAFELNINAQDVLNFTVNVGVNLVRMLGQAAISNTIAGIIDMRNDGLTTMGAIEHYWGRQTPVGKTMTVVAAGFAGVYVYYWARSAIESFLSIYNDMRNIYNESEAKNQAQAAGTAALAA
jgi:hypothetical protein